MEIVIEPASQTLPEHTVSTQGQAHSKCSIKMTYPKRNEIELFVVRWMELESVIQSEVSQKEKK